MRKAGLPFSHCPPAFDRAGRNFESVFHCSEAIALILTTQRSLPTHRNCGCHWCGQRLGRVPCAARIAASQLCRSRLIMRRRPQRGWRGRLACELWRRCEMPCPFRAHRMPRLFLVELSSFFEAQQGSSLIQNLEARMLTLRQLPATCYHGCPFHYGRIFRSRAQDAAVATKPGCAKV